jgi:hypothetical protein
MSVYFVYRNHYEGPSGKHVRRFEADSVLGWFQGIWERAKQADDASEWVKTEIGADVYGFASIFEAARKQSLPPPSSGLKLRSYLEHLYVEEEIRYKPHALQVLTDDDEIELAYYIFDDYHLGQHPGRAAYLLHNDWRLPTTSSDKPRKPSFATKPVQPPGSGSGITYLAFLACYDSGGLSHLDEMATACRIKGVRVSGLSNYLEATPPGEDWPFELTLLRSQIHADDPTKLRLKAALERVASLPVTRLGEMNSRPQPGLDTIDKARNYIANTVNTLGGTFDHDPSKSLIGTSDNLLQLCLHTGTCFGNDVFHQWIIFDDLWAGQHPYLAEGVLRYAKRWDVLT